MAWLGAYKFLLLIRRHISKQKYCLNKLVNRANVYVPTTTLNEKKTLKLLL